MNKSLWVKAYSISSSFCKYFLTAPPAALLAFREVAFFFEISRTPPSFR
jgi:hypothetical protein